MSSGVSTGVELLALYNRPPAREGHVKYYTVKVPLQVQNCDEGVKGVEANWLDHMTQHFNNGASLVDGYFHLGNVSGKMTQHYCRWKELMSHEGLNKRTC